MEKKTEERKINSQLAGKSQEKSQAGIENRANGEELKWPQGIYSCHKWKQVRTGWT